MENYIGFYDAATGRFVESDSPPAASSSSDPPSVLSSQTPPATPPTGIEAQPSDQSDPCFEMVDLKEQIDAAMSYYETLVNRCQTEKNVREDSTLKESICKNCPPQSSLVMTLKPTPGEQHPLTPPPPPPPIGSTPPAEGQPRLNLPSSTTTTARPAAATSQRPITPIETGTTPAPSSTPQSGFVHGVETRLPGQPEMLGISVPEKPSAQRPQELGPEYGPQRPSGMPAAEAPPPPPPPPPSPFLQTIELGALPPLPTGFGGLTLPPLDIGGLSGFIGGGNFGGGCIMCGGGGIGGISVGGFG